MGDIDQDWCKSRAHCLLYNRIRSSRPHFSVFSDLHSTASSRPRSLPCESDPWSGSRHAPLYSARRTFTNWYRHSSNSLKRPLREFSCDIIYRLPPHSVILDSISFEIHQVFWLQEASADSSLPSKLCLVIHSFQHRKFSPRLYQRVESFTCLISQSELRPHLDLLPEQGSFSTL